MIVILIVFEVLVFMVLGWYLLFFLIKIIFLFLNFWMVFFGIIIGVECWLVVIVFLIIVLSGYLLVLLFNFINVNEYGLLFSDGVK